MHQSRGLCHVHKGAAAAALPCRTRRQAPAKSANARAHVGGAISCSWVHGSLQWQALCCLRAGEAPYRSSMARRLACHVCVSSRRRALLLLGEAPAAALAVSAASVQAADSRCCCCRSAGCRRMRRFVNGRVATAASACCSHAGAAPPCSTASPSALSVAASGSSLRRLPWSLALGRKRWPLYGLWLPARRRRWRGSAATPNLAPRRLAFSAATRARIYDTDARQQGRVQGRLRAKSMCSACRRLAALGESHAHHHTPRTSCSRAPLNRLTSSARGSGGGCAWPPDGSMAAQIAVHTPRKA